MCTKSEGKWSTICNNSTCLSAFCTTDCKHHCTLLTQAPLHSTDLFRICQATVFSSSKQPDHTKAVQASCIVLMSDGEHGFICRTRYKFSGRCNLLRKSLIH